MTRVEKLILKKRFNCAVVEDLCKVYPDQIMSAESLGDLHGDFPSRPQHWQVSTEVEANGE